ncbi:hypothetical protein H9P43_002416 [Blastocladiella emersonii ATCC 22665]|nr:hypothetical protein H9P43_002416 [Blastocladiella emersonii ATCC 22665]
MSPVPIVTADSSEGGECPVAQQPAKKGLLSSIGSAFSLKSPRLSPTSADSAAVKATTVVASGIEAAIHYAPTTTAPEIRAQITAKLGLTGDEWYLVTEDKRPVLDLLPATLAQFAKLHVVEGKLTIKQDVGPPGLPVFGNVHQLAPDFIAAMRNFTRDYGKTFRMRAFNIPLVATSDPELVEAVMNESPFFTKKIAGVFAELQALGGRGLFTTDTSDPKWAPAHKLLTPTFSAGAMKMYLPDMLDATTKLVGSLEQMDGQVVDIPQWMTRFALETISMCGFGTTFGLLDGPDALLHPFIDAMNFCLNESKERDNHIRLYKMIPTARNYRFDAGVKLMQDTVNQVLQQRHAAPDANKRDLLNFMLTATTESGEKLDDQNIIDQCVTFLIAGHETTATLLSWTLWLLTQSPAVEAKVLEEAVRVCGRDPAAPITQQQLGQLTYTTMVLKESLRLYPPAPGLFKACKSSTVIGGGTRVNAGDIMLVNIVGMHRNRDAWGANPDVFNPEHFSKENEAKRHPYAWLPFSSGERSCIGMAFAMQEAKIALATLVRKFTFEYDGPVPLPYDLKALTLRPTSLRLTVHKRDSLPELADLATTSAQLAAKDPALGSTSLLASLPDSAEGRSKNVVVVYASNMGTSADFAHQLEATAKRFHLPATTMTLDAWAASPASIDKSALHVFITSTYNGSPPDNAVAAAAWLKAADPAAQPLAGLTYAVFGCGNSQWSRTFQAFPQYVDARVNELGGERLLPVGAGDADGDIDAHFTAWHARFWVAVQDLLSIAAPLSDAKEHPMMQSAMSLVELQVELVSGDGVAPVRPASHPAAKLIVNRELLRPVEGIEGIEGKSTRHIEFELTPSSSDSGAVPTYREGDHFEVWPENDPAMVAAVAQHLGLDLDSAFLLRGTIANPKSPAASIGVDRACRVRDALTYFVDLAGMVRAPLAEVVATRQGDEATATAIRHKDANVTKRVTTSFRSAGDAIQAAPGITLPDVLTHAAPVFPRRYSIASSARLTPGRVSLCVGVGPLGLCASFLQRVEPGHQVHSLVKPCPDAFHLPVEGADTPVVMVCAGTGLAPFLSFLQERKARGTTAESHLFFGCRHPQHDLIHGEELQQYVSEGVLTKLHVAYSRDPAAKAKYVQHAIQAEADLVFDLLHERKAVFYICGSARGMAKDVAAAITGIFAAKLGGDGDAHVDALRNAGHYIEDVWG